MQLVPPSSADYAACDVCRVPAQVVLSANETEAPMADDIEVHFNRMGLSGGILVVVAIGTDVYGATDVEPVAALHAAASKAAEDRALRGQPVDANDIVERGIGRMPSGV